jgi:hypothetical protein
MNPDRVDQLLRRASDDVRATVVRHTVPPPIEALGDRGHPIRRSVLGVAAVTVTVSLGLAIVGDRTTRVPPTIEAPGPESTVELEVPAAAAAAAIDDLCVGVVGIATVLADPPDETDAWVALGDELDDLAAQLARSRSGLDADTTRRYDRFVALAGQAVSLGAQGGFTPAGVRSHDAVAVAGDLVEFVAVPGCELQLPRSNDEEDQG